MSIAQAHHSLLQTLALEQDEPCFVYDLDGLAEHIRHLLDQDVVKLWYAVKANPLSAIIKTLDEQGMCFDVASLGELEQVMRQGVDVSKVLNTGPAKSKKQINAFLDLGVRTFVAESLNQVKWLNELAKERSATLDILLRVQLRWPSSEKNPLGGDAITPFGLEPEQWHNLYLADYSALNFVGIHIFQWGNILDVAQLTHLWQQMIAPLQALCERLGFAMQILDLGGGLGVPYDASTEPLEWQKVSKALQQIKQQSGVQELWMELGRYAVAPFGYYLNPVVEQKQNYDNHQLIVSGGINHLLRPAVAGQAFPVTLLRDSDAPMRKYAIHGPLCTALDSLGEHSLPADINEHDWLVFSQAGAYGFTESMPFFLCHPLAGEFTIKQGNLHCIRESQAAASYLK